VCELGPDLDYEMWEGVSHFIMMEKPNEFNAGSDGVSREAWARAGLASERAPGAIRAAADDRRAMRAEFS
jgi:hypothetical protein